MGKLVALAILTKKPSTSVSGGSSLIDQVDDLSDLITKELENIKNSGKVPTLEDIQNTVEKIKDSTIENLDTAVITVLKEQTIDIEDYVKNMVERVIEENFIKE